MRPDGEVVRKITLNGHSHLSAGIAFGPVEAGHIYVTDIRAGKVLQYGADGGNPLASLGGQTGGFNNIVGLTMSPDGKLYAAEMSGLRVQVLDPSSGGFLRDYKLPCPPQYIAFQPGQTDWFDVTCGEGGFFSVNVKSGDIHRIDFGNGRRLTDTAGAVYAPDCTLYVEDSGQIVAYRVRH